MSSYAPDAIMYPELGASCLYAFIGFAVAVTATFATSINRFKTNDTDSKPTIRELLLTLTGAAMVMAFSSMVISLGFPTVGSIFVPGADTLISNTQVYDVRWFALGLITMLFTLVNSGFMGLDMLATMKMIGFAIAYGAGVFMMWRGSSLWLLLVFGLLALGAWASMIAFGFIHRRIKIQAKSLQSILYVVLYGYMAAQLSLAVLCSPAIGLAGSEWVMWWYESINVAAIILIPAAVMFVVPMRRELVLSMNARRALDGPTAVGPDLMQQQTNDRLYKNMDTSLSKPSEYRMPARRNVNPTY